MIIRAEKHKKWKITKILYIYTFITQAILTLFNHSSWFSKKILLISSEIPLMKRMDMKILEYSRKINKKLSEMKLELENLFLQGEGVLAKNFLRKFLKS